MPLKHSEFSYPMALVGLTLTSLFWAGNALTARYISADLSPLALSFWRWCLPSLYMLPFCLLYVRRYRREIIQHRWQILCLAALGIGTYNSLLYTAASYTTAINITLVSSTLPFGTLLCSLWLLKSRPAKREISGALLSCAGALTILSHGEFTRLLNLHFNSGDLIMFAAMLWWSLYSVLYKKWAIPIPAMALLLILIPLGTLFILPLFFVQNNFSLAIEVNSKVFWALAYVATLPSVLAYWLWNKGVDVVGPGIASIFSYLIPVFTAMLSIPLLGENLHIYHGIGALLALAGLWLASWRKG